MDGNPEPTKPDDKPTLLCTEEWCVACGWCDNRCGTPLIERTIIPTAHMVETLHEELGASTSEELLELLDCLVMEHFGTDELTKEQEAYLDALDLEYDWHDYHAEWNRGYEASIRGAY
jgi:hypothetical protein